jgi:hypothetical protein
VLAFAGSRLLVLAAGAAGVLDVAKHAPTGAVAATRHVLGPVGYVLAGSMDRFDAGWYLRIAGQGYGSGRAGQLAFFPLYPMMMRGVAAMTGSYVLAGIAISAVSFLLALVLVHRLTELELGVRAADATVLLLSFCPLSFFFTAIYTESLFLALSVGSVYAARRGRWPLAYLLGALAALTRPTGVLLVLGLAVMRLRSRGHSIRGLLGLLTVPAALAAYVGLQIAAGHPWAQISGSERVWQRVAVGPVEGVLAGLAAAVRGVGRVASGGVIYHPSLAGPLSVGAESIVLGLVLIASCAALVACARRLPLPYTLVAAAELAVCLSSPRIGQPLVSFDRYTLTIFPLWMAAGAWAAERRLVVPAVCAGAALLVFYTVQFSSWSFIG